MHYEQMSDFEINKAFLSWKHGDSEHVKQLNMLCAPAVYLRHGYREVFDFNNPADAWPVIVENGITLIHEGKEWSALANASVSSGWDVSFDHVYWHSNPFRAAMIVYLMMQEDK